MYRYPYLVLKFKINMEVFFYPMIKNGVAYVNYIGLDITGIFFNSILRIQS